MHSRVSAAPAYADLRRFSNGRNFSQWTGNDSKALMKVMNYPSGRYYDHSQSTGLSCSYFGACFTQNGAMLVCIYGALLSLSLKCNHKLRSQENKIWTWVIPATLKYLYWNWCPWDDFSTMSACTCTLFRLYYTFWLTKWPVFVNYWIETQEICQGSLATDKSLQCPTSNGLHDHLAWQIDRITSNLFKMSYAGWYDCSLCCADSH